VIWHVVRFDLSSLSEEVRTGLEAQMADLAAIDVVSFVRVARDIVDPGVTGLMVGFANEAALAAYRDHRDDRPLVERVEELGVPRVRLDIETDDEPTVLP
jgi:hypothetical protein